MANYSLTQTGSQVQTILNSVGALNDLHTTHKSAVVDAINEVADAVGDISDLDVGAADLVDAVNQVNDKADIAKLEVQYENLSPNASKTFTARQNNNIGLLVYARGSTAWGIYIYTYWDSGLREIEKGGTSMTISHSANSYSFTISNPTNVTVPMIFIS